MKTIQDQIIGIGIYILAGIGLLVTHHRFSETVFALENISKYIGEDALFMLFLKYFCLWFGSFLIILALIRTAVLIKNRK